MRLAVLLSAIAVAIGTTPALADVWPFRTPSGNIYCFVGLGEGPSDINCSIVDRNGTPPQPKPQVCEAGWGHHYDMLGYGPVRMICGDPGTKDSAPGVDVFRYGTTSNFGDIVCSSSEKGLECRNSEGHGFFLSRKSQRVF